jgi:hypothetical protein
MRPGEDNVNKKIGGVSPNLASADIWSCRFVFHEPKSAMAVTPWMQAKIRFSRFYVDVAHIVAVCYRWTLLLLFKHK